MCEQNRLKQEVVIKTIFGMAISVVLGLSLWLGRPYALSKQVVVNDVHQCRVGSKEEVNKDAAALSASKVNLVNAEIDAKSHIPSAVIELDKGNIVGSLADFTHAAKLSLPAVVHIKARHNAKAVQRSLNNPLDQFLKEFFGDEFGLSPREDMRPAQEYVGSGVIYTSNGYIITNNHVIEGADHIEITLNDNTFCVAKLVGADPVTDLALLKIEKNDLPFLKLGNSDKLEVGEWVLAVGNPFNLNSTVTKGIVSAKSRNLDLGNRSGNKLSIHSFIQTDAVLNQGNSGGALVNMKGELVGINTAIFSTRSASFMGYGFAVPSSLVKKVTDDLLQYGAVQRVLLGITFGKVNIELAKKMGLKNLGGVCIYSVEENSPCGKLLQKEDVITHINGRKINQPTELTEIVACAKPGDKMTITLYRKGKEKNIDIVLEKEPDTMQVVHKNDTLSVEGTIFSGVN